MLPSQIVAGEDFYAGWNVALSASWTGDDLLGLVPGCGSAYPIVVASSNGKAEPVWRPELTSMAAMGLVRSVE